MERDEHLGPYARGDALIALGRLRDALQYLGGSKAVTAGNPELDPFRAKAAQVTVPVLFLFQWDDGLMTPQACLDLWDAFASTEKTMHINPGGHLGIPGFEMQAVEAFFARHLR